MSSDGLNSGPSTASFNALESRVVVTAADATEVQDWLAKASVGDFIVRLEERLEEGAVVEVLVSADSMQVPLRCRVKQVFRSGLDRHGTMVEWLDRDGAAAGDAAAKVELGEESRRSLFERSPAKRVYVPNSDSDQFEVQTEGPPDLRSPESWAEEHFPEVDEVREEVAAHQTEAVPDPDGVAQSGAESAEDDSESNIPVLTLRKPPEAEVGADIFDAASLNPDSQDNLDKAAVDEERRSQIREADRGADALEELLSTSGEWRARALSGRNGSAGAEANGSGEGLTEEAKQAVTHSETRGVSLSHTIGQMNPNEKARLATRASRQERRLLIRDHTFAVQMGLLNNPRTENKEVLEIAKNPQTTGGILKRLASDRKWASNYEIQAALVKHPGTPSPLAIRLLDQMRISDLRTLAKSAALRENVRKAALRLYLQRSP